MSDQDPIIWQGRPETVSGEFKRVNPKDYDKAGHHEETIRKLGQIDENANEHLKTYNEERRLYKPQLENMEATKIMKEHCVPGQPAPLNVNETARSNVGTETSAENANVRAGQETDRLQTLAEMPPAQVTPRTTSVDEFRKHLNEKSREGFSRALFIENANDITRDRDR